MGAHFYWNQLLMASTGSAFSRPQASFEDVQNDVDRMDAVLLTQSVLQSNCLARAAESLRQCQQANKDDRACVNQMVNFAREMDSEPASCCVNKGFEVAKNECVKPFRSLANALLENNGLLEQATKEYAAFNKCIEEKLSKVSDEDLFA